MLFYGDTNNYLFACSTEIIWYLRAFDYFQIRDWTQIFFFLTEANECLIVIPLLTLEKWTTLKKFDMPVCHKVKITQSITILYIKWKFVMSFD